MKLPSLLKLATITLIITILGLFAATAVLAHGGRPVGEYEFNDVGFAVEPAFEGAINGVELEVVKEQNGAPVEGLEKSLQVEVTHVSSGAAKTFELQPDFRRPGRYTADFIPTAPGHYTFRFFGTIEGLAVDETFSSQSGEFDSVISGKELHFPDEMPSMREIKGVVQGVQVTAGEAQDSASSANTLAIVGVVLGAIGAVSGIAALVMARKR